MSVIKIGWIIGIIVGVLKNNIFLVRVNKLFLFRGYFVFFNCYVIENMSNEIYIF